MAICARTPSPISSNLLRCPQSAKSPDLPLVSACHGSRLDFTLTAIVGPLAVVIHTTRRQTITWPYAQEPPRTSPSPSKNVSGAAPLWQWKYQQRSLIIDEDTPKLRCFSIEIIRILLVISAISVPKNHVININQQPHFSINNHSYPCSRSFDQTTTSMIDQEDYRKDHGSFAGA